MASGFDNMVAPEFVRLAQEYGVNVQGVVEAIYQPTYDTATYAATGQTQLVFFQNPVGQAGKTVQDTNMRASGQFPAPQQFLATQVCVQFKPGFVPSRTGSAGTGEAKYLNDVWTVLNSGALELNVGSKNKLTDAPLGKFPPTHLLEVSGALSDSTTAAASKLSVIDYAEGKGMLYDITPINIPWAQNFDVTMKWNSAVALPSNVAGSIRVTLNGFLYRLAQ